MNTLPADKGWLGAPEDWGLSRAKHAELGDELTDHMYCMASNEGRQAVAESQEQLAKPQVRRKLAGVHLADQVYATLNRWPTKQEWRELMWLGIWYAVIIASDVTALNAEHVDKAISWPYGESAPWIVVSWTTAAWLLQGVSRAGFFASFLYCLWRAWKLGAGVWLARILQLKLIHTVLVVGATWLLGKALWESSWSSYHTYGHRADWPIWITAPLVSGLLLLVAASVFLGSRKRSGALALGIVLLAVFLYPGGPTLSFDIRIEQPLAWEITTREDGTRVFGASTDPDKIKAAVERWESRSRILTESNIARNRYEVEYDEVYCFPGHITSWPRLKPGRFGRYGPYGHENVIFAYDRKLVETPFSRGPLCVPGAGVGWLAAPIPLLGIIGLVGLVLLMGRRGPFEFLVYLALCVFAIGSTIMPFFFAQELSKVVELSPKAVVHTPFPGFENLLNGYNMAENWLLIFGLLLSAGIPWLLTSLFLRPTTARESVDDSPIAE